MRLIDADRFKKYLTEGTEEALKRCFLMGTLTKEQEKNVDAILANFLLDIDEQPTVDVDTKPVKTAHWIEFMDRLYICSNCEGKILKYKRNFKDGTLIYNRPNFCEHCGAKMEEED